jgi:hypothetical protein
MRSFSSSATVLVLIGLASACSGRGQDKLVQADKGTANVQSATAQTYGMSLAAMSQVERKSELAAAARNADETCNEITSLSPPRADDEVPVWNVTCADGGNLAMIVGDRAISRVLRTTAARPPAPPEPEFGGTYVASEPIMNMPYMIEFNGPRNCLVYTETGYYDSRDEGTCTPTEGDMEFAMGGPFGAATRYFRAEGPQLAILSPQRTNSHSHQAIVMNEQFDG